MVKKEQVPDSKGRFGIYGGVYVAETLVPALEELAQKYELIKDNKQTTVKHPIGNGNIPVLIK